MCSIFIIIFFFKVRQRTAAAAAAAAVLPPTFSQAHQFGPFFIATRNGDSLRMLWRLLCFGRKRRKAKQK